MMLLYQLNELKKAALAPARHWADTNDIFLDLIGNDNPVSTALKASNETLKRAALLSIKPEFNINSINCKINGNISEVPITEEVVFSKTFCDLKHFKKNSNSIQQPKMLIVAPLSGHFSTLLRGTVEKCLEDYDVYITDWLDSRLIPLKEGDFSLDDYIDYLLDFMRFIGEKAHILAVCQPAVPVLIATALLEEYNEPCSPHSMVLMGGPIDTRINPGQVDDFAKNHSIKWIKNNLINTIPNYYPGKGRKVCPGFIMLNGFMMLNMDRHQQATRDLFQNLIKGDEDKIEKHNQFYNEYRAVMDIPATYFLDSIQHVFKEHSIANGKMRWRNNLVNPKAIHKAKLLTIEGELDDISCPGQTYAAHDICSNIPDQNKHHYLQLGAGHYGIFNGSRWRNFIYPQITEFCGID